MRKSAFFAVAALLILLKNFSWAGPVGNTVDPAILSKGLVWENNSVAFILGEESDFVSDRKFEAVDAELSFHGIRLGATFSERFMFYVLTGMSDIDFESFDTDSGFYWGTGATLVVFEKQITDEDFFRLGFDAKYRGTKFDINTIPGFVVNESDWSYHEWQIGFAASFQLFDFVPYAGMKYSDVKSDLSYTIRSNEYSFDLDVEDNFGFFAGIGFNIKDCASFNLEMRFMDEQAVTVGGMIRF